jgi:hypothetical protein
MKADVHRRKSEFKNSFQHLDCVSIKHGTHLNKSTFRLETQINYCMKRCIFSLDITATVKLETPLESIEHIYELTFNISCVYHGEDVLLAELQLQPLIDADRNRHHEAAVIGSRLVTVLERIEEQVYRSVAVNITVAQEAEANTTESTPTTLVVTDSVRRWAQLQAATSRGGSSTSGGNHVFQVRISTMLTGSDGKDSDPEGLVAGDPLLVVFSNDRKRRKTEERELQEMEARELEAALDMENVNGDGEDGEDVDDTDEDGGEQNSEEDAEILQDASRSTEDRHRRSLESMQTVETNRTFSEKQQLLSIRWRRHSLDNISSVANQSTSLFPSSNSRQPSSDYVRLRRAATAAAAHKSASGTSMSARDGKKRRRNSVSNTTPVSSSQRGRNSCRRRSMYVNFADIHWDNWIIAPKGYQVREQT